MSSDPVGLRDFKIPVNQVASLTEFRTRAGEAFYYRFYPAWSENLLVLYHGLGGDSRYLAKLAKEIAEKGLASVVTPDLRGHGPKGHVEVAKLAREDQLEIDAEELFVHIRQKHAAIRVYLGGHSLGAGLALKMAAGPGAASWAGFVALAPYLPMDAIATADGFAGWTRIEGDRVTLGMPKEVLVGTEVLQYEKSFFAGATPPDGLPAILNAKTARVFVGCPGEDRIFDADRSLAYFSDVESAVRVKIDGASHMGLVGERSALPALVEQLGRFL